MGTRSSLAVVGLNSIPPRYDNKKCLGSLISLPWVTECHTMDKGTAVRPCIRTSIPVQFSVYRNGRYEVSTVALLPYSTRGQCHCIAFPIDCSDAKTSHTSAEYRPSRHSYLPLLSPLFFISNNYFLFCLWSLLVCSFLTIATRRSCAVAKTITRLTAAHFY